MPLGADWTYSRNLADCKLAKTAMSDLSFLLGEFDRVDYGVETLLRLSASLAFCNEFLSSMNHVASLAATSAVAPRGSQFAHASAWLVAIRSVLACRRRTDSSSSSSGAVPKKTSFSRSPVPSPPPAEVVGVGRGMNMDWGRSWLVFGAVFLPSCGGLADDAVPGTKPTGGMPGSVPDSPRGGTGGTSTAATAGGLGATGGLPTSVTLVTGTASCEPPCGVELLADGATYAGDAWARLVYDSSKGSFLLFNDVSFTPAVLTTVIAFSFNGSTGYSTWSTSSLWFVFSLNYQYSSGYNGYSVMRDIPITSQLFDSSAGTSYLVTYQFGNRTVSVLAARIAACDSSLATVCQNERDCPSVEVGDTSSLSAACSACYSAVRTCSSTNCAADCPGLGGNVCQMCETDHGCHVAFMQCAGMDYMPAATLTFPRDW